MRIHFLPAEQQKRNDKIIEKLSRMGYVLLIVALATVALGAKIYLWPPAPPSGPQIMSMDGHTTYGDGLLVGPNLVLCAARISEPVDFVAGSEHIKGRKINSASISNGAEFTLLQLETPSSLTPYVPVAIEAGEALRATSAGQEWRGTAREVQSEEITTEPEFSLQSGVGIVRQADPTTLAGVSAQNNSKITIVSAKAIFAHFAELSSH